MKSRKDLILGLCLVLLPTVVATLWHASVSHSTGDRLAALNQPLYPVIERTSGIIGRIHELRDIFLSPEAANDEQLMLCRGLIRANEEDFQYLVLHAGEREVFQLHKTASRLARDGLALHAKRAVDPDQSRPLLEAEFREESERLAADLEAFRFRQSQRFADQLGRVADDAAQMHAVSPFLTLTALLLGLVAALYFGKLYNDKNSALTNAHLALESRFQEICKVNKRLEEEVGERGHVEEKLRQSLLFEEAMAGISNLFTTIYHPDLRSVVRILGQVVGVDLTFIGIFNQTDKSVAKVLEWTKNDEGMCFPDPTQLDLSRYPDLHQRLIRRQKIMVEDVAGLDGAGGQERLFMTGLGLRALCLVPVAAKERGIWGYLGVADMGQARYWSEDEKRILRTVGAMLANFLGRNAAEKQLKHDAVHDTLTGLPNRALVMDRLAHAVERIKRHPEERFAVLFLDLDRFKPVNDSLGHAVGDCLLVAVSRRLRQCVRSIDTVARIGGDEFICLLEDLGDDHEAEHFAQKIHEAMAVPFELDEHEVFVTASIGIAVWRPDYPSAEELMRDADVAMYRAKSMGKGRSVFFEKSMQTHTVGTLKMETDLRRALDRGEFHMFYQPIVSLESGEIVAFESLLRWDHSLRGMVPPDQFITMAEDIGTMVDLGRWALEQACSQLAAWHQMGFPELSVSVNVSVQQFHHEDLGVLIREVLARTGVPPASLKLELTESILMENLETNIAMLQRLRDIGLEIMVDDFGTGYSSLSYLHRFPLSALKIDRAFLQNVPDNEENAAITAAILAMADQLGLDVVAEGIENEEQLLFLWGKRCQLVQGYLFNAPLTREQATAALYKRETVALLNHLTCSTRP